MESIIREAIEKRRVLEFVYDFRYRLVEPHVLGVKDAEEQLLAYQVAGSGRGGRLPRWQTFEVKRMSELRMSDAEFEGARDKAPEQQGDFDRILAVVQEKER